MTEVIIQECREYGLDTLMQKLNEGIEKLGGWEAFVHPGDRVF